MSSYSRRRGKGEVVRAKGLRSVPIRIEPSREAQYQSKTQSSVRRTAAKVQERTIASNRIIDFIILSNLTLSLRS